MIIVALISLALPLTLIVAGLTLWVRDWREERNYFEILDNSDNL